METPRGGFIGRLSERVIGYVALGLVGLGCFALYRMGPEGRTAIWETIWRSLVWLAISAALPWVARLFLSRLLEIGSNWVGLAMLAGLSVVNAVSGMLLLAAWPVGGWQWTATLAALAVAGTYNYLVTEYLAEQQEGN
jgi:hypothetical protein